MKNFIAGISPKTRINRFYFLILILSFIFGFFYSNNSNINIYYGELIQTEKTINEINSKKCDKINNQIFANKIRKSDIELGIKAENENPDCINLIGFISRNKDSLIPVTDNSIKAHFEKYFNYYIIKNNMANGLIIFSLALFSIFAFKVVAKLIRWVINGEAK